MVEDLPHILVVDDDTKLRNLLRRYLSDQKYRVTVAPDAAEARAQLQALEFDLIVLDIMMPGESGLALTKSLRETRDIPILLLTAMTEVESRIKGFESGADDYLPKPFEPRELILRIDAILRRARAQEDSPAGGRVYFGGFCFDLQRRELRKGEAYVRLTAAEKSLLLALARQPGQAVSREDLTAESEMIGNQRTIDVQMTRLRRKIESNPKFPRYLQTVRGTGYVLVPD